jgi:hypothetical protein
MGLAFKNKCEGINGGKKILPGLPVLFIWICFYILFLPNPVLNSKGKTNLHYTLIAFKNVLEITDADESFYFKYPTSIYADTEENIYVLDSNRILKFSKEGNFVKNLVTKGQGPGEVTNISNLYLAEGKIIIHNNYPSKIIWMDSTGTFLKEFRLEKTDYVNFSHYYGGSYFFFHSNIPAIKSSECYKDVDYIFSSVNQAGKKWTKIHAFPVKEYIVKHDSAFGSFTIARLITVVREGRYLMVSHTPEYKIKCFDLEEKRVIKEFGTDYQRQEIPGKLSAKFNRGRAILNGKMFRKPVQKHFNDIQQLLTYKNRIWVVTSTVDENKGVRVDVYNFNGDIIRQFYLLLHGQSDMYSHNWYICGEFLYALDRPEKEEPKVLKYKINL